MARVEYSWATQGARQNVDTLYFLYILPKNAKKGGVVETYPRALVPLKLTTKVY